MRVLFYSSVKTKKMFSVQSYYRNDILILRDLGHEVYLTKTFLSFLLFWKYDIAFLYFYRYSFLAALFARCFNKRIYFTGGIDYLDRDFATKKQRFIQTIFFYICNKLSDVCILVSTADEENVKAIYGGKLPCNCKRSFHIVDFDKFEYKGDFSQKKIQFVTLAWMVNLDNVFRKGVDKSIKMFAAIIKKQPEYKLYIAGPSGKGSRYIQKLIVDLHLEDSVIYLGAISEMDKICLLKESRYYLQLSTYEGFGIAGIEALAAGCLVIHSGKGGLKDGIGKYGCIVDIKDDVALSNSLLTICEEKYDVEKLREGIEYVRNNFSYRVRFNTFKNIIGAI